MKKYFPKTCSSAPRAKDSEFKHAGGTMSPMRCHRAGARASTAVSVRPPFQIVPLPALSVSRYIFAISINRARRMLHTSKELKRLEHLPRPIVAFARDLGPGDQIEPHRHGRAQLVYAQRGVLTVTAEAGIWVIPPQRAVWMPGGMAHSIRASGNVAMRSLYVQPKAAPALLRECRVVSVSPLLRELIGQAFGIPALYDVDGPDGRLMTVILDQLEQLPSAKLHLPAPSDPRLRRITSALANDPANRRGLAQWARLAGASSRTLSRLFTKETGMTFGAWRQQARLLKAVEWLAQDMPVTAIALDLGYDSPSAFIAMFRRSFGVSPSRYFQKH